MIAICIASNFLSAAFSSIASPRLPHILSNQADLHFNTPVALFFDTSFFYAYFTNAFVILIWIFFVFACLSIWHYWHDMIKNEMAMEQVKKNIASVNDVEQNKTESVKARLVHNLDANSLVAKRVRELQQISRNGGDPDVAALTDNLVVREVSRLSFSRYVASIMVLLGLCGAIYGLSNLVLKMGPQLRKVQELSRQISDNQTNTTNETNSSLIAVQNAIATLVDGMAGSLEDTQGAFAASLTGVLLSVFLLFFNWAISKKQALFLTGLESFTVIYLAPLFRLPPPVFQLSAAVDSLYSGAEQATKLAQRLDDFVVRSIQSVELIFAGSRKFEESAKAIEISHQSVVTAQDKMLELAEQFTGLNKLIEQHQSGSKDEITGVISAVGSNSVNIQKALDEWRLKHEEGLRIIEVFFKNSEEKQNTLQKNSLNEINLFRAQLFESFEKIQKFGQDQIKSMLTEQKQYVDNLSEAVLNGLGYKELVKELDKIFKDERESFVNKINEVVSQQNKVVSQQHENLLSNTKQLMGHFSKLSESLENIHLPVSVSSEKDTFDLDLLVKVSERMLTQQKKSYEISGKLSKNFEKMINAVFFIASGFGFCLAFGFLTVIGRALNIFTDMTTLPVAVLFFISIVVFISIFAYLRNED